MTTPAKKSINCMQILMALSSYRCRDNFSLIENAQGPDPLCPPVHAEPQTKGKTTTKNALLNNAYECSLIHMHHAESISIGEKRYINVKYSTPTILKIVRTQATKSGFL